MVKQKDIKNIIIDINPNSTFMESDDELIQNFLLTDLEIKIKSNNIKKNIQKILVKSHLYIKDSKIWFTAQPYILWINSGVLTLTL